MSVANILNVLREQVTVEIGIITFAPDTTVIPNAPDVRRQLDQSIQAFVYIDYDDYGTLKMKTKF